MSVVWLRNRTRPNRLSDTSVTIGFDVSTAPSCSHPDRRPGALPPASSCCVLGRAACVLGGVMPHYRPDPASLAPSSPPPARYRRRRVSPPPPVITTAPARHTAGRLPTWFGSRRSRLSGSITTTTRSTPGSSADGSRWGLADRDHGGRAGHRRTCGPTPLRVRWRARDRQPLCRARPVRPDGSTHEWAHDEVAKRRGRAAGRGRSGCPAPPRDDPNRVDERGPEEQRHRDQEPVAQVVLEMMAAQREVVAVGQSRDQRAVDDQ